MPFLDASGLILGVFLAWFLGFGIKFESFRGQKSLGRDVCSCGRPWDLYAPAKTFDEHVELGLLAVRLGFGFGLQ